jgi:hypothetical protein
MTTLHKLVIASMISVFAGGAAMASDASEAGNPGMLLYSNGTMVALKADSNMHAMLMRNAKPYTGGMIYASGGKLYTIENARMSDGRMLFDLLSPGNPEFMVDVVNR